MISCEKVKELLMTSYTDGELDEKSRKEVKAHLQKCAECRELEILINKEIVKPLKASKVLEPSSTVWESIEKAISGESEQVLETKTESFWEKIHGIVLKPVPAMLSSLSIISLLALLIYHVSVNNLPENTDIYVENYFSKHIRFLDYLESDAGNYYTKSDHLGFMTPIEKYLF
jgi:hypothetical protein